ncbi:hypothetical protein EVAR_29279_1 [Eumeta japonica]|uniref:Uncharacterized protein n=1 Tax=Eumeta variegata TaxID=151549 RepID=A0A4C1VTJ5_EUMVA|nr:hypothetical protein EVAR_29279_1 [Eumeta japonica]
MKIHFPRERHTIRAVRFAHIFMHENGFSMALESIKIRYDNAASFLMQFRDRRGGNEVVTSPPSTLECSQGPMNIPFGVVAHAKCPRPRWHGRPMWTVIRIFRAYIQLKPAD